MIKVKNLKKIYDNQDVLLDVSFDVEKGEIAAIIGNSGSGKSTILRCLMNLEEANGGSISILGKNLVKDGIYAPARTIKDIINEIGIIFQNYNLFPNMTVMKNLTLPYELKFKDKLKAKSLAKELLQKVNLSFKADCYPIKLSGGEQQRVAIARSLMLKPNILLFDEPTSALDPTSTKEVLKIIKDISKENVTIIVVTHEMDFAKDVADKIIFMSEGKIEEEGSPEKMFFNPSSEKLRQFLCKQQ